MSHVNNITDSLGNIQSGTKVAPTALRKLSLRVLELLNDVILVDTEWNEKKTEIETSQRLLGQLIKAAGVEDLAALESVDQFIVQLADLKAASLDDIHAANRGDPSATSLQEISICYPSVVALLNYRIANSLLRLEVPILPRLISYLTYCQTGIDIHPGATIARGCFIDHGSGVVIGETAVIGKHCTLYQGVTLGAKSFPKYDDGSVVKGLDRHPILKDRVTIYAGATLLGRITIGHDSVIGGNVWVTTDLPPRSMILQTKYHQSLFNQGEGI